MHKKIIAAISAFVGVLAFTAGLASATADSQTVTLATSSGGTMKDTFVAVALVAVPLAITVLLVRKALPWVRGILHI